MPTDDLMPPRCDKHHSRMVKVRVKFTDIQLEAPAFQCAEINCTRFFMDGRGYFDSINGSVLDEKYQQRCPICKTPMYLAEFDSETEVWRCPLSGCGQQQRMVG
jgi:hypothetical protein